jgi:hypothetical protein
MTKINEHGSAPETPSPIYRHASETVRSTNEAGGEVPRSNYADKTPNTPITQG